MTEPVRSRLSLVLWAASAAFIVYGTTIPFNFVHDRQQVADHLARVTWNPLIAADTGQRVSIPDLVGTVTNVTGDMVVAAVVSRAGVAETQGEPASSVDA